MDAFYFFLIAISAVGMIAVIILVFGFSIMYRKEKNPVATLGIGTADSMRYRYLVLLLGDWIPLRGDAVISRACRSDQTGTLAFRLWDKSNNFAHIRGP